MGNNKKMLSRRNETIKKDFVYILRTDPRFYKNDDIKYSLRSLDKNFIGKGKVFIVGGRPNWINVNTVTHIYAEDKERNKLVNAIHKILIACKDRRISKDFILMNDDFLFLKETNDIKSYNIGTIEEMKRTHRTKGGYYYKAICDTLEILQSKNMSTISYEAHYPIIINKNNFIQIIKETGKIPYLFRSFYGNRYIKESKKIKDFKVFNHNQFFKGKEREFMSLSNEIEKYPSIKEWYSRIFKERSKYERSMKELFITTRDIVINDKMYSRGSKVDINLNKKEREELGIIKVLSQ